MDDTCQHTVRTHEGEKGGAMAELEVDRGRGCRGRWWGTEEVGGWQVAAMVSTSDSGWSLSLSPFLLGSIYHQHDAG